METKCCRKCGVDKPLSEYHRDGSGYRGACRACRGARARKVTLPREDYPSLLPWGTPDQRACAELYAAGHTVYEIGARLGITASTVTSRLAALRSRAARNGWAPEHDMVHTAPEAFHVKGVSTYYDRDGEVRGQWVKTQADKDEAVHRALEALERVMAGVEPAAPLRPPEHHDEDLLCVYPIGDPHIGMYAWEQESGEDFDTLIATRDLRDAVDTLVASAPNAHTAILAPLGDTFHSDSRKNATTAGTPVDVDGRQTRVIDMGVDCIIHCARRLLEKHMLVKVVVVPGNHDAYTSVLLGKALELYFRNEPRLHVDRSPSGYQYHRFGRNFLGFAHGDGAKPNMLGPIMATDRAEDWGATEFRRWYTGHIHHDTVKEFHGCIVESFRTLAAKDAWHSHKGYRSGRDMKCDVLHHRYGQVGRHIVNIKAIREEQCKKTK